VVRELKGALVDETNRLAVVRGGIRNTGAANSRVAGARRCGPYERKREVASV
jgi:hypothetical protein